MIHLDTCFLIGALAPGSSEDRTLRRWLKEGQVLGASVVSFAEFLCGPLDDRQIALAAKLVPEREAFIEEDARLAAKLFNTTGRRRGSLVDCMIAATAIRCGAAIATANAADHRRFEAHGLTLAG